MAESLILWLADEADGPNERHRYVARIVFDVILKCDYRWAANEEEWLGSSHRKIQYGGAAPKDKSKVSWIPAAGLLKSLPGKGFAGSFATLSSASTIMFDAGMPPRSMIW